MTASLLILTKGFSFLTKIIGYVWKAFKLVLAVAIVTAVLLGVQAYRSISMGVLPAANTTPNASAPMARYTTPFDFSIYQD